MKKISYYSFAYVLAGYLLWDNLRIEKTCYQIISETLPNGFDGFKIVQISDYHNRGISKALIKKVSRISPDIIVLTGDLIDSRKRDIKEALDLLKGLSELAPCYFVCGNHEKRLSYYEWHTLLAGMKHFGIRILDDEGIFLKRGEEQIFLVGLSDLGTWTSKNEAKRHTKKILENLIPSSEYSLLLAHRPELFEVYQASGINLALTGHAHGGQVRLFNRGLFAPHQGFFPKYTSGLYQKEGLSMVVSRGLGRSLLPLRLNNPPELVEVTLKVKEV